jgi:hypothetical protein
MGIGDGDEKRPAFRLAREVIQLLDRRVMDLLIAVEMQTGMTDPSLPPLRYACSSARPTPGGQAAASSESS